MLVGLIHTHRTNRSMNTCLGLTLKRTSPGGGLNQPIAGLPVSFILPVPPRACVEGQWTVGPTGACPPVPLQSQPASATGVSLMLPQQTGPQVST